MPDQLLGFDEHAGGLTAAAGAATGPGGLAGARDLRWADIPEPVRRRLAWLLLDLTAVCVAGRAAPAATIAADFAADAYGGDAATALLDGRRLSMPGAAWANGVLANVLDFDDGHRITKGHPGAIVIPAALAAAESRDASLEEFLVAVALGYEVAIRAGVELHARASQYHASGAWGGLGAATAAGLLLGSSDEALEHAVGLAEYHAPIAPIMRSVADPAMTKDATGWGAFVGTGSAMLARRGYTSLSSEFLGSRSLDDLGQRWQLLDLYVKPYPCCRWTQPAIEAALLLSRGRGLLPDELRRVEIRTFAAADGLARGKPATTEDAQYSLVWPVAVALVRGSFEVEDVLERLDDPNVDAVAERTTVVVDTELDGLFPHRRLAAVTVELVDGTLVESGRFEARGDPDDPDWESVVADKVQRVLGGDPERPAAMVRSDPPAARLGGKSLPELVGLLTYALGDRWNDSEPARPIRQEV